MEQTLGKRIAHHRKRLGLTQDALAEQLGITAQAVSKWENDLSCPDIAMLPRLAEFFGITTDELLGREAPEKVHEAEVIHDEDDEDNDSTHGIHYEDNHGQSWNFHWDSGRKHALKFAICVLCVGALTLLSRIMEWDVSFWSILWPSFIIFTGFGSSFKRFSMFNLACILFGGYFLVSNLGFWTLEIAGELIFPICVVLFGVSLLIDALRKPKKPKFRVTKRGKNGDKTRMHHQNGSNSFSCDVTFGEMNHKVSVPLLEKGSAEVSFGTLIVDLSGVDAVADDCRVTADCSFGEIRFLIPSKYRVECMSDTTFADVHTQGHPDDHPEAVIELQADVSFGSISLHYI